MSHPEPGKAPASFPNWLATIGWCLVPGVAVGAADVARAAFGGDSFLNIHGGTPGWALSMVVMLSILATVTWLGAVAVFVLWNASRGLAFTRVDTAEILGLLAAILGIAGWALNE